MTPTTGLLAMTKKSPNKHGDQIIWIGAAFAALFLFMSLMHEFNFLSAIPFQEHLLRHYATFICFTPSLLSAANSLHRM